MRPEPAPRPPPRGEKHVIASVSQLWWMLLVPCVGRSMLSTIWLMLQWREASAKDSWRMACLHVFARLFLDMPWYDNR